MLLTYEKYISKFNLDNTDESKSKYDAYCKKINDSETQRPDTSKPIMDAKG